MNARRRLTAIAALTLGALAATPALVATAAGAHGAQSDADDATRVVRVVRTSPGAVTEIPFNLFGHDGGTGAHRVLVPGDVVATAVTVENATPSSGTLTARLIDASVTGDEIGDDDRFDYVTVNGAPLADVADAGGMVVASGIALAEGEAVTLDFDVVFDLRNDGALSNIGNSAMRGEREAVFRLQLSIEADAPAPTPAPTPPTPAPTPPAVDGPAAETGGIVVGGPPWWAVLALAGAGLALLGFAVRRRDDREPEPRQK